MSASIIGSQESSRFATSSPKKVITPRPLVSGACFRLNSSTAAPHLDKLPHMVHAKRGDLTLRWKRTQLAPSGISFGLNRSVEIPLQRASPSGPCSAVCGAEVPLLAHTVASPAVTQCRCLRDSAVSQCWCRSDVALLCPQNVMSSHDPGTTRAFGV